MARETVFSVGHMGGFPRPVRTLVDRLLGLRTLAALYMGIPEGLGADEFLDSTLEVLDVGLEVDDGDLARVPRSGPTVVVANHPFGGIEGIALARILRRLRPDVKVMANYLLGRIPELAELFFLVDPFDSPGAARRNVAALRKIIRHVADGGLLVVFPAGEVAHLDLQLRRVVDPPWDPTIGRIIRRSGCSVVPARFAGRNGALFQALGLVHPTLRTLRLPRELLNRRGSRLALTIGSPVSSRTLAQWPTDGELIAFLHRRSEVLAERLPTAERDVSAQASQNFIREVAPAVSSDELAREIDGLPDESCLVDSDQHAVHVAEAESIPRVLEEIGRLRELSFRAIGEGTGKELDLDPFDSSYLHLFCWSREPPEIIGAYRLGPTDRVLADSGLDGLYTSTLFRYDHRLFSTMGPAYELGRSFIRLEHQKSFAGLMLLWKGIGELVRRNPRYANLFGPVSISADYLTVSQQLVVAFLGQSSHDHEWSRWVRPRTPFRPRRRNFLPNPADLRSFDEVSSLVSEMEADGKGVPILLKQYLKLGGRMLGFNVDPEFSNVLDVLVLVDLRLTDPRILGRYMGREGAQEFLGFHREHGITAE